MIDYNKINWYNRCYVYNKQGTITNLYYGYDKNYYYFVHHEYGNSEVISRFNHYSYGEKDKFSLSDKMKEFIKNNHIKISSFEEFDEIRNKYINRLSKIKILKNGYI